MFPYVEIAPKSEGATAIANIEGKKLRTPVLTVVESLPLSNKSEAAISNIGNNNRSNKRRERKYQMIRAT